jgi:penicillin-binding protein 2
MGKKNPDYIRTEISTQYTPTARNKRSLRDESSAPIARIVGMGAFIALAFLGLIVRLWYLQVVQGDTHLQTALYTGKGTIMRVRPARGIIKDSDGHPLVVNVTKFAIFARPGNGPDQFPMPLSEKDYAKELEKAEKKSQKVIDKIHKKQETLLKERDERLKALQSITGITPESAIKNLEAQQKKVISGQPLKISEGISDEDLIARLVEQKSAVPGIYADVVTVRRYAADQFAAHLLGYVDDISATSLQEKRRLFNTSQSPADDYSPDDKIGVKGIERQYESYLHGTPGYQELSKRSTVMSSTAPIEGSSIQLHLEERVQRAAESAIEGKKGAIVAMDPETGAVLALASWPKYDPNVFQMNALPEEMNQFLNKNKDQPQANRAVAPEPPGSTYKIVTATACLAEKITSLGRSITCTGAIRRKGGTLKCMSKNGHGSVSLVGAMARSCNVYYGTLGIELEEKKANNIQKWGNAFGLGVPTGADFGDYKGNIPDHNATLKENRPWGWGDAAKAGIGQGYVTTSPLQMVRVVSAISNGGIIYEPHFVKAIISPDGKKQIIAPKIASKLPVTKETLSAVRQGLYACINSGTGQKARVGGGVDVMGKTGSAELGRRLPGSTKQASHAWFVGVGSRGGKKIAVCVFIDGHGQDLHGGADAAPPASRVISSYFYDTNQVPRISRPTSELSQQIEAAQKAKVVRDPTAPSPPALFAPAQGKLSTQHTHSRTRRRRSSR